MIDSTARAHIGVTGLTVVGSNIARNFARHGSKWQRFHGAVWRVGACVCQRR